MEIEIKKLKKYYKNGFVLSIKHMLFRDNSIIGLVGNNGAGKTTLLNCLLDLTKINEGVVKYNGKDIRILQNPWKLYTSSFLDQSFLLDFLTAKEYFYLVGALYNIKEEQISKLLEKYNSFLFDSEKLLSNKYIRELSSGNKQKVGLIAALFVKPKILLLDEPHNHLDPKSQIILKHLLLELNKTNDSTIVISSHNLNFVSEICNRLILLEDGKIVNDEIVSDGTLEKLENYFKQQIITY